MTPGPYETDDEDYPTARTPGAGGYASTTDAPHESEDVAYPVATGPGDEDYPGVNDPG